MPMNQINGYIDEINRVEEIKKRNMPKVSKGKR